MLKSLFSNSDFIGIDIGYCNIKVVDVKISNNDINMHNFEIIPTPSNSIKNGSIVDPERIIIEIRKSLNSNKIKTRKAKIVIPGNQVICRVLLLDVQIGLDECSIVSSYILKNLPVNSQEYQIDYRILDRTIKGSDIELRILVMAIPKKQVFDYHEILQGLDLKPCSVDISANGIEKFFRRNIIVKEKRTYFTSQRFTKSSSNTLAVLDFGAESTTVNIFKDQILEFNKVIAIGSNKLNEVIVQGLAMQKRPDEAEAMKKLYGLTNPTFDATNAQITAHQCMVIVMEQLMKNILQCFEYYEKRCSGEKVAKSFIIGGGSQLRGLKEFSEEHIGIPVYLLMYSDIEGIFIKDGLNDDKLYFLINALGITL